MGIKNIKEGYRQTEIGIFPEEWDIVTLNECSQKILDGEHISPKFTNSGIPYLSSQHIKSKISFFTASKLSDLNSSA